MAIGTTETQIAQAEEYIRQLKQRQQQEQMRQQQYYSQQPQYQYQQPVPQQAPTVDNTTNVNWIAVKSVDDVTGIVVGQNQNRWFMFENAQIMGVKTVDNLGLPTVSYYKFEKFDPYAEKKAQEVQTQTPQINLEDYVKKEEFEKAQGEIVKLVALVEELKAQKTTPIVSATKTTNKKEIKEVV